MYGPFLNMVFAFGLDYLLRAENKLILLAMVNLLVIRILYRQIMKASVHKMQVCSVCPPPPPPNNGAPIGDVIFCTKFLTQKRAKADWLLSQLPGVGSLDSQIALLFKSDQSKRVNN